MGKLVLEARRRDEIVKQVYNDCKHTVGEVLTPYNKNQADKWGDEIVVLAIAANYGMYIRNNEWDKDDSPKIITCKSLSSGEIFYCTPGFLIKKETVK